MFRRKQILSLSPSFIIYEPEEHFNNDGELITESVAQNKTLPNPEMFDLKNMLDAGIDIEETSSKVIGAKSVNADNVVRKYTKKSESSNNEE